MLRVRAGHSAGRRLQFLPSPLTRSIQTRPGA